VHKDEGNPKSSVSLIKTVINDHSHLLSKLPGIAPGMALFGTNKPGITQDSRIKCVENPLKPG